MLRILLMLGLAAAAGVAGWQVWQLEQVRASQRHDRARLDAITLRTTRALLDIRASQRAYLSPGQGIAFWKSRVDQQLLTLRDDLQALKNASNGTLSASSSAIAADDAALDALGEVSRLERRIAEHVEAGRLEHAADLVYADNVRASLALDQAVDAALTAHRIELQAQQTDMRWREGGILALTALAGALLAFVVMPSRGSRSRLGDAEADAAAATQAGPADGVLSLRPSTATVRTTAAASPARAGNAATAAKPATAATAATSTNAAAAAATKRANEAQPAAAKPATATAATATAGSATAAKPATAAARAAAGGARGPSAAVVAARLQLGTAGTPTPAPLTAARETATVRGDLATPAAVARAATDAAAAPPSASASAQTLVGAQASYGAKGATGTQAVTSSGSGAGTAPGGSGDGRPSTADGAPAAAAAGSPSLLTAADLCVSMARVSDAAALQPLLARVADQLDAIGVIVWLQDVDSQTLEPALTHGYAADTLSHLRALDLDADNATARAYRTGQPQTVAGRGAEPGALVVPMQTATGCVGVIAAELRHGREQDPATLALARIVAAQLAMLTAAPAG